jgi:hypothetical protein
LVLNSKRTCPEVSAPMATTLFRNIFLERFIGIPKVLLRCGFDSSESVLVC